MSWFTLMEMALVAIMTVYLTYHTHLVFRPVREAKLITFFNYCSIDFFYVRLV